MEEPEKWWPGRDKHLPCFLKGRQGRCKHANKGEKRTQLSHPVCRSCPLLCSVSSFLVHSDLQPLCLTVSGAAAFCYEQRKKNGLEFPRLRRVTGISAAKDSTASGQGNIISTSLVRALRLPSEHLPTSVHILSSTLAPTPACSPPSLFKVLDALQR